METYLTPEKAASYLEERGVSFKVDSLAVMRCKGRGPRFFKLNRRVFYRPEDLDAYLAGSVQTVETVDTYQARVGAA
jgi:hypothetical protein